MRVAGAVAALILFVGLVLVLPFAQARAADESRLDVVTTTSMIGDAARIVAGDRAVVTNLMGEGVDPHSYRQTRSDVVRLGEADLILYNGLYLEAQLEELLHEFASRKPVVAVAERLPADTLLGSQQYEGRFDPHVWMDVALWSQVVAAIRDVLIKENPENREAFAANAESYLTELERLDEYARTVLATVPDSERALVTAHDAFSYFGRAYAFEVIGIQGISTESEAGLSRIEEIVDLIVQRGISAVFVESSVSERNVRALIEGARAQGHDLRVGGELFSDAMGSPGTYEGTYLGMIDHNVTTITRALGGEAPALGMNDMLQTRS